MAEVKACVVKLKNDLESNRSYDEFIRQLFQYKAGIDATTKLRVDMTVIMAAARKGEIKMIKEAVRRFNSCYKSFHDKIDGMYDNQSLQIAAQYYLKSRFVFYVNELMNLHNGDVGVKNTKKVVNAKSKIEVNACFAKLEVDLESNDLYVAFIRQIFQYKEGIDATKKLNLDVFDIVAAVGSGRIKKIRDVVRKFNTYYKSYHEKIDGMYSNQSLQIATQYFQKARLVFHVNELISPPKLDGSIKVLV